MRKATKRMEEEPVEVSTDPSPPKKTKVREKKAPAVPISTRLPTMRAAKTKAAAQLNNNVEGEPIERIKKSRASAKPTMQKSNSSDDIASKTSGELKKSKSAEDIDQQGAPAPKKGKNVAAKKPVAKKATMEGKAKPKGKVAKEVEAEEEEEGSEEEQPRLIAKKGYSGTATVKKATAPKKNTRRRGKPTAADDAEEDTENAVEEVKTGKAKNSKVHGKKTSPAEDPKEEVEDEKEEVEDVAKEAPEDEEETMKPKRGKKGGAPMKKGRGKKAATPSIESDEKEVQENGEVQDENVQEYVEEPKKEIKPVKGKKGKAAIAKNRGRKAGPKAKEVEDDKDNEAEGEKEVKKHSENGTGPQNEEETDVDNEEPAENGKDDLIIEKNKIR